MLRNDTRNQHFLPRVEQKLNALNPQAADRNLRIYSFQLVNRERYSLALQSPNGRPIGSNLSLFDLFSFDVPGDSRLRLNFEALFQKYEANIEAHTKSLLAKLNARSGDIKAEIIDLFAAKLLNFVRNPFSIVKVLNSFPGVASYDPTDPALLADYRRIVSGRKPHQAHLCAQLGISDAQYVEWLRLLFMLLVPMAEGRPNFFEEMIKGLLENRKMHVAAFVCEYDNARCLLSDRGFSQPIEDGPHMAFSFNLCATAFVDFVFADPATLVRGNASPEFIAQAIASWERLPEKQIHVTFLRNNLDMLARYNRRVVEQCHERVYCSVKDGLILSKPGPLGEPVALPQQPCLRLEHLESSDPFGVPGAKFKNFAPRGSGRKSGTFGRPPRTRKGLPQAISRFHSAPFPRTDRQQAVCAQPPKSPPFGQGAALDPISASKVDPKRHRTGSKVNHRAYLGDDRSRSSVRRGRCRTMKSPLTLRARAI